MSNIDDWLEAFYEDRTHTGELRHNLDGPDWDDDDWSDDDD